MGGEGWRRIGQSDLDLPLPDDDALHHMLNDLSPVFKGELRPAGVEGAGFGGEVGGRELLDLQEVDLPLEPRDLGIKLLLPAFPEDLFRSRKARGCEPAVEGTDGRASPCSAATACFAPAPTESREAPRFSPNRGVGRLQSALATSAGREEEIPELLVEDRFQVADRDLVPAP